MSKCCDVVFIEYSEYTDIDFKEVSSFWCKNSLGQRVYFKTRSREVATATCNELYGVGFYKINSGKSGKSSGTESAVGRLNMKSRMNSKGVR